MRRILHHRTNTNDTAKAAVIKSAMNLAQRTWPTVNDELMKWIATEEHQKQPLKEMPCQLASLTISREQQTSVYQPQFSY